MGECYLPVSAATLPDAESRPLNDYEAVGRMLLAAVAHGVPVPSAWASATVVRFLVGDHAGGAFAESDLRRELVTLGRPWQPAWAALTMGQVGFGGDGDGATPCTARAVWNHLTTGHRSRGAALCAMHAGFLGTSGDGAAATIAPFAAVLSDWTPRQRQLVLCGDEAFTGAELVGRFVPAEETGTQQAPSGADMERLRAAVIDHLSGDEHRSFLFWVTGHRSLACDTRVEVALERWVASRRLRVAPARCVSPPPPAQRPVTATAQARQRRKRRSSPAHSAVPW